MPARPTVSNIPPASPRPISSGTTPGSIAWLTNPQDVIPGAVMAYRQAKPETRAMIIAYLKELN
ncbi:hypothetical protein ACVIW0_006576 [Bradyrhizobium sp. USDA 4454]